MDLSGGYSESTLGGLPAVFYHYPQCPPKGGWPPRIHAVIDIGFPLDRDELKVALEHLAVRVSEECERQGRTDKTVQLRFVEVGVPKP